MHDSLTSLDGDIVRARCWPRKFSVLAIDPVINGRGKDKIKIENYVKIKNLSPSILLGKYFWNIWTYSDRIDEGRLMRDRIDK